MTITIDSRQVKPGDTFIPVKGKHFDGRDFIDEVIQKGGHVLDVDLFDYAKKYRKKLNCTVVAIAGSAGKTTLKDMCASILEQTHQVVKTHENQNNEYGVPLTILAATANTDILIVEMAMRKKNDLTFLTKIVQPDIVLFSGVGKSHIEFFETQRQLAQAKSEIFRRSLKWQSEKKRVALINNGTAYSDLITKKAKQSGYRCIPYSGEDKPTQNINACYEIGHFFGISDTQIQAGISRCKTSQHRMKKTTKNNITIIDDSYNANPDGMLYAFQYVRQFQGRKIAVLGEMKELGIHSRNEHQQIVDTAGEEGFDLIFVLGHAYEDSRSSLIPIYHFTDKDLLNKTISQECKPGDIVLIKGSRRLKMEDTVRYLNDALS